jgi:single-stranded-DNA-specific exonuclease
MAHTKRWLIAPALTPQANENLAVFPPILRQLLFNRGYASEAEARAFLRASTDLNLDPFQMTGMETAVQRIRQAIEAGEAIAIYGDYDVDGVTATALLVQTLRVLGAEVRPYIPNRFDEGYGLNTDALDTLKAEGVRLVITVDCGIRSPAEAVYSRSIGLDLIVTDHHQPAGEIPSAFAVINPKQPGDAYPDKDLAGVGVAYKIAQALLANVPESTFLPENLLDLVALGTVADLAPLTGENRFLVRNGLNQIRQTKRQGLFSLAAVSDVNLSQVSAMTIGFMLGPRLNAAGRLESALAAYDLLSTTDVFQAGQLAQQLNNQNRQRQDLTRKIQDEAEALALAEDPEALVLFAVHPEFNPGVVGLAAARLVETYYRPAIVGQQGEETTRCSCRSIPEFHITDALDQCADLLIRHGGHAAAAGFTVRNDNLMELKERLKGQARKQFTGLDLRPTMAADIEVQFDALRFELVKHLEYFQPTGYGNPEAVFVTRGAQIKSSRTVGADAKHLKLTVTDGKLAIDAIGFRLGHLLENLPERADLLYTFELNEYNGRSSLQLNLKDIKATGLPD